MKQRKDHVYVRLEANYKISPHTGILRFKRFFSFKAGQVVSITTSGEIAPRMYSICSGENQEYAEIMYRLIPSGELTPRLEVLKAGMKIRVSQPFGSFICSPDPAYLIATGTGIAPYLSMVRSGYSVAKILIHGSRDPSDFYFSDYLQENMKERYIRCCSGNASPAYFHGRVTGFLSSKSTLPADYKYYLCGSAEMVVDTRDLLIGRGIPFRQILSEIYF